MWLYMWFYISGFTVSCTYGGWISSIHLPVQLSGRQSVIISRSSYWRDIHLTQVLKLSILWIILRHISPFPSTSFLLHAAQACSSRCWVSLCSSFHSAVSDADALQLTCVLVGKKLISFLAGNTAISDGNCIFYENFPFNKILMEVKRIISVTSEF